MPRLVIVGVVHHLHLSEINAVVVGLQNLLELKKIVEKSIILWIFFYLKGKVHAVYMNVHNGQVEGKNKEAVVSTHHRPQVRVVEDVAIVVHRKAVPIHTKLGTDIGREVKKGTLYGGTSFSISATGTSVPATPRSSAMRREFCNWWKIFRRGYPKKIKSPFYPL